MSLSSGLPGVSSSCEPDVAWREARRSLSLKLPRKDCTLGDCLWRPGEEMRPNMFEENGLKFCAEVLYFTMMFTNKY